MSRELPHFQAGIRFYSFSVGLSKMIRACCLEESPVLRPEVNCSKWSACIKIHEDRAKRGRCFEASVKEKFDRFESLKIKRNRGSDILARKGGWL